MHRGDNIKKFILEKPDQIGISSIVLLVLIIFVVTYFASGSFSPITSPNSINPAIKNTVLFYLLANFMNDGWITFGLLPILLVIILLNLFMIRRRNNFYQILILSAILVIIFTSLLYLLFPFTRGIGVSGLNMSLVGALLVILSYIIENGLKLGSHNIFLPIFILSVLYVPLIYHTYWLVVVIIACVAIMLYRVFRNISFKLIYHNQFTLKPGVNSRSVFTAIIAIDALTIFLLITLAYPAQIRISGNIFIDIPVHYVSFIAGIIAAFIVTHATKHQSS